MQLPPEGVRSLLEDQASDHPHHSIFSPSGAATAASDSWERLVSNLKGLGAAEVLKDMGLFQVRVISAG